MIVFIQVVSKASKQMLSSVPYVHSPRQLQHQDPAHCIQRWLCSFIGTLCHTPTHLGHELHQDVQKEHDCKCMDSRTSIRETFQFAKKQLLLNTIQIYCSYFYGTMLWRWGGGQVLQVLEQLCQVVLGIIQEYTCVFGWQSSHMRGSIYSTASITRYVKFNRSLRSSPSKEVAVVARIVGSDAVGHIAPLTQTNLE